MSGNGLACFIFRFLNRPQHDEVCFPHFESRRHEHVQQALGLQRQPGTVLLSDGYEAYARYASQSGITHAQCWAHCRRVFFEAQGAEPKGAGEALRQIGALYRIEDEIRQAQLSGEANPTCWPRCWCSHAWG